MGLKRVDPIKTRTRNPLPVFSYRVCVIFVSRVKIAGPTHVHASIFFYYCHGVSNMCLIRLVVGFDIIKKIYKPISFYKIDSIKENCLFIINMSKILLIEIISQHPPSRKKIF